MYIDVKITCWQRINGLPEIPLDKIINIIKDKGISEIFEISSMWKSLESTEDYISIEENQGNPTIEIYKDDGEMVWNDVDEFLIQSTTNNVE